MQRLHIGGLAHVVNALVMLSIFSAGNSYVYTTSRIPFGMALEGRVPRALATCNSRGVPVYCVYVAMLFSVLAFLQLGHTSSVVLQWCVHFSLNSSCLLIIVGRKDHALLDRGGDGQLCYDRVHVSPVPRRTSELYVYPLKPDN
jgi:amino acid permease